MRQRREMEAAAEGDGCGSGGRGGKNYFGARRGGDCAPHRKRNEPRQRASAASPVPLPLLGSFLFAEPIFRTKDRRGMNLQ
jgi:hypothetical protein